LEADLKDALHLGNLELHYQPIVNLETNAIVSFEALMRWRNPRRGLMYPGEFLHIAEETGVLLDLEKWVLNEACRQIHRWRIQFPFKPPLSVSVNLSNRHFQQPDMPDQIAAVLQSTGLAPQALQLEAIESTLTQNAGPVPQNLEKLRQLGVKLYIDDFGTGYSSLSYLQAISPDMIKIDGSFVSQIAQGAPSCCSPCCVWRMSSRCRPSPKGWRLPCSTSACAVWAAIMPRFFDPLTRTEVARCWLRFISNLEIRSEPMQPNILRQRLAMANPHWARACTARGRRWWKRWGTPACSIMWSSWRNTPPTTPTPWKTSAGRLTCTACPP
jgi:EAL domain-containing protein (putative c-di-GMP-specific phosphodiesterase class I)